MRSIGFLGFTIFGFALLAGCSRTRSLPEPKDPLRAAAPLCAAERYRECAELLRTGLRRRPDDPEIHYRLGLALRDMRDLEGAKAELYAAHELHPDYKDSLIRLAEVMVKSPSLQDVEWSGEHAQSVLETKDDPAIRADAYLTLGVGKLRLGDAGGAAENFRKALDAKPSYIPAALDLAVLEWVNGEPARAEPLLRNAIEASKDASALSAAGEFYRLERRAPEAERAFLQALDRNSQNESALLNLAAIWMSAGRFSSAESLYVRLAQSPKYRHIHAAFLYQTGRSKEAVAELQKLLAADDTDTLVRRTLEAALLGSGRYQEAVTLANQTLAAHRCNPPALLLSGEAWLSSGAYANASEAGNRAKGCNPAAAATHFLLAMLSAAQHDWIHANYELHEVLRIEPRNINARVLFARVLTEEGHPQLALDALGEMRRMSLKDEPDSRLIASVRRASRSDSGGVWSEERNWTLLASGEFNRVLAFVDSDLSVSRNADFLLQRAVAGFGAGKNDSRSFLDDALRVNPENRGAQRARAILDRTPPASEWTRYASDLAAQSRQAVAGADLLDLPGEVARLSFVLREPLPNL